MWKYLQDALINYESVVSVEGESEQVPDLTSLIPLPIVEEAFESKEHDGQEPYEQLLGHLVAEDMTID
jgi:hypothetical protein